MLRTIASEEGYTTAANFNDRARAAGLATQTDVSTAVSAEAVNRATAISSATSGLVRNDDFTTKANAFISGLGFVKEDDLDTKIDSRTSALGLIRGSDVDSKISVATSTLATKTELATEKTARETAIATEATNRATAITAEATARASAITSATSGLIRGENFNTLLSAAATGLGFAKTEDVDAKITQAETAINKATNQKLGTAFGIDIKEGEDVQPAALQTQLQGFASASLLNAGVFSRLKDDGTTESWSLMTDMTNIKTAVAKLATALETLEARIDTLHGTTDEGDEGDGGFDIGFAGSVSDLIRPGTSINTGFLGGLSSPSTKDD